jgi:hypothetical protein
VIQNSIEFALPVFGTYAPTSLGTTLTHLASCAEPISGAPTPEASKDSARPAGDATSAAPTGADALPATPAGAKVGSGRAGPPLLPVPKEIWRMVDFLLRRLEPVAGRRSEGPSRDAAAPEWEARSLFAAEGDAEEAARVLECIDGGAPLPEETRPSAVGRCMLDLLRSLEECVVPADCVADCVRIGASDVGSRGREEVLSAVAGAPPVNVNTLVYLSAFLARLPGPAKAREGRKEESVADVYRSVSSAGEIPSARALALTFAPACFGSGDGAVNGDVDAQAGYICHLMHSASSGPLRATFDI